MYAYITVFTSQPTLSVVSLLNFLNVIFYFTFIMCFSWILIMLIIFSCAFGYLYILLCEVCIQMFYCALFFFLIFLFCLCIQTLRFQYKSFIRHIFCKYLLLTMWFIFLLLIMPFFFNRTQLCTSMSVSAVQQSESAIHVCALVSQLCPTLWRVGHMDSMNPWTVTCRTPLFM